MYEGTEREIVIQESVFSRHGTDRVLRYAFELAATRPRKHLTVATKSNGIAISMPWWDARADARAAGYPEVTVDKQHIDILSARFVLQPKRFDVVVASNLFGDILSDLGPATTGTIGLAPSANLNPERKFPSLFEPVHGSAPDIYGKNIANPIAMIWSGALMLDFLTHGSGAGRAAHDAIVRRSRPCSRRARARAISRSSRLSTLPIALRGSSSTKCRSARRWVLPTRCVEPAQQFVGTRRRRQRVARRTRPASRPTAPMARRRPPHRPPPGARAARPRGRSGRC